MAKKPKITPEMVAEHGLSESEYQIILDRMGREPNLNELGIFSVMWSEHCSYKSSRRHLSKFLTTGDKVIHCLLYTSPSPRDQRGSRMPSSA